MCVPWFKYCVCSEVNDKDAEPSYNSNLFSMIGTIFLWMFWPSFNGALATDTQQHRVIINTLLSLCACCVSAFSFSMLLRHEGAWPVCFAACAFR